MNRCYCQMSVGRCRKDWDKQHKHDS